MLSWLCRPCRLRASGTNEVGPVEEVDASKLDRTLLFASGVVMERALLGDLLKTITARKFPIVNLKLAKATDSKLQSFYKSHSIAKELEQINAEIPFVVAIIQKSSALKTLPALLAQFRADHALHLEDLLCSENAKIAHRDVATWFSIEELQSKPPLELAGSKKTEEHADGDAPADPTAHGEEGTVEANDSLSDTNPFHETNGDVHDHESTHELVQSAENK
uniref:Glutaredoxin domain-containing protein n=1 Tax=Steinernema glaseri TaxID=37863 RepID=A0A1I8ADN0_9BILA